MFKRILIAIDPDEPRTMLAFPPALLLADSCGAALIVCTVVPDTEAMLRTEWAAIGYRKLLETARAKTRLAVSRITDRGVRIEVATGSVTSGVLAVASDLAADLIVLASHLPGPRDHLLTSHGARIARRARCSVLVARPTELMLVTRQSFRM